MTLVGFETTIPVLERAKTVDDLYVAVSVIFGGDTTENILAYGRHIN
jgi:hypothetical protein